MIYRLFLIIIFIIFSSCRNESLFNQYHSIPMVWHKDSALERLMAAWSTKKGHRYWEQLGVESELFEEKTKAGLRALRVRMANEPEFLGPAAIALGHRYNMDSRDEGAEERNEIFRDEGTVFSCSYANECSEVCPKNVDPAAAVNQAKFNAVVDWATGLVLPRGGKQ